MKAVPILQQRVVVSEDAFMELVVWRLEHPLPPSTHLLKYRLAYVVGGECVVLFDNERGKGDHRHFSGSERAYSFSNVDRLLADFESDIARWNDENSRA